MGLDCWGKTGPGAQTLSHAGPRYGCREPNCHCFLQSLTERMEIVSCSSVNQLSWICSIIGVHAEGVLFDFAFSKKLREDLITGLLSPHQEESSGCWMNAAAWSCVKQRVMLQVLHNHNTAGALHQGVFFSLLTPEHHGGAYFGFSNRMSVQKLWRYFDLCSHVCLEDQWPHPVSSKHSCLIP